LQPRSSFQSVMSPNFRSVTYRHEGTYKGMGQDSSLPLCTSITVPAGFVGPLQCDASQGPPTYPASQTQLSSVEQDVAALQQQILGLTPTAPTTGTTSYWPWIIGGVALLLLVGMARR
jgi:hypothetical protein